MRQLIFSTSYCHDQASRYLVSLWAGLTRRLNPDADIILIDSASPCLPDLSDLDINVWSFPDNIGHLGKTGKDGWGRAFCKGLSDAIALDYSQAVFIESDLLFANPIGPTLEKMWRMDVPFACPMAAPYQFIETGLMFMDVKAMDRHALIENYNWEKPVANEPPERRIENILSPWLFTLPFRGCRNDYGYATAKNFDEAFPFGCDYITHCDDFAVYKKFLECLG